MVFFFKFFFALLCVRVHGPQLIHIEQTAVSAHPLLLKEQATPAFQQQGNGHQQNNGSREDQPHNGAYNVYKSLQSQHLGILHGGRYAYHWVAGHNIAAHVVKLTFFYKLLQGGDVDVHQHTHIFQFFNKGIQILRRPVGLLAGEVDVHLVDGGQAHPA